METQYDMVIRGGTILDGSGGPAFEGDVAVVGGIIEKLGSFEGTGRQEINAAGRLVTPGFVDLHTHYDGQATWDRRFAPSSDHGVTTVVMGNCGVGFAPCRPEERGILVKVMEGVEDIPEIVMTEGIPWKWQTFPEYLDFLRTRQFDADCAAYLPHAAVRVFVMGERAVRGEPSTEEDRQHMADLVTEAMAAGAVGVSTSRALFHRDPEGNLAPHVLAGRLELLALAQGLRKAGRGTFQIVAQLLGEQLKDFVAEAGALSPDEQVRHEMELLHEIARVAGRPLHFTLADMSEAPGMYKRVLELVDAGNAQGLEIKAQIFPRPIGILYGLHLSLHPFTLHPSYKAIAHLPLAERLARMRSPEFRERMLAERPDENHPNPIIRFLVARSLDSYPMGSEPDYAPPPQASIAAQAARRGVSVWEAAYDLLLMEEGSLTLFLPMNNFTDNSLDNVFEMLNHPHTVLGLGDGGAHYGLICDASFPTFMLTYWTRDREGSKLPLPEVVNALTRRNALAVGLADRGLIAPGLRADLNVIDYDRLTLGAPEVICDLPAGGHRLIQRASGYVATIVNGDVTYREGVATGALPGRVATPNAKEGALPRAAARPVLSARLG
ncbi:N-acyl-D-amino-acid deacylase family protein [Sphingosinicella rhizophila]|uniref:Amidohydrolase family protein n=1 Tax=Sphingosinicella rhizophila TaxID=3050082 RepID=A0ABU3QAW8_9SPHN|nr:amidohydrolase family protein [Sphingosinicella sp. GR2756]MDT9600547.1 amidohydrolase family protein [Sphingosinicella sp. GR2756]